MVIEYKPCCVFLWVYLLCFFRSTGKARARPIDDRLFAFLHEVSISGAFLESVLSKSSKKKSFFSCAGF